MQGHTLRTSLGWTAGCKVSCHGLTCQPSLRPLEDDFCECSPQALVIPQRPALALSQARSEAPTFRLCSDSSQRPPSAFAGTTWLSTLFEYNLELSILLLLLPPSLWDCRCAPSCLGYSGLGIKPGTITHGRQAHYQMSRIHSPQRLLFLVLIL